MPAEELFTNRRARERHNGTPLRSERDHYLSHMRAEGSSARRVQMESGTLLHVVRILKLDVLRIMPIEVIEDATNTWAAAQN